MAFGTFTFTGHFEGLTGIPASGKVRIDGNPQVITDTAGDKIRVGPRTVILNSAGNFSITLPSDSTTGNSTGIAYRVTTDLKGLSNIATLNFYARPISATVDLADLVNVAIVELGNAPTGPQGATGATGPQGPQGLPGVNAVANDTATAGYITTAGSATQSAADGRYASKSTAITVTEAPLTPYKFGATSSNASDNTAALVAMFNQAATATANTATKADIRLPPGLWRTSSKLPLTSGMSIKGAGRDKNVTRLNAIPGSGFTGTAMFEWTTAISGVRIEDMYIDNNSVPGIHLFNAGSTGGIDASTFKNLILSNQTTDSRIWNQNGTGSFIQMTFEECQMSHASTGTVAPFYVRSLGGAANCNRFKQVRADGNNNTLTPFFWFESGTDQAYLNDYVFDGIIGEQNRGGLIYMLAPSNVTCISCVDWDAVGSYTADLFRFDKSATGYTPRDITMIGCARRGGSLAAGVRDIYVDSGASGVTLIACDPTPPSQGAVVSLPVGSSTINMRNAGGNAYRSQFGPMGAAAYTTANRPAATLYEPGVAIYDSTLGKPIWSNGTNWRDATGTVV